MLTQVLDPLKLYRDCICTSVTTRCNRIASGTYTWTCIRREKREDTVKQVDIIPITVYFSYTRNSARFRTHRGNVIEQFHPIRTRLTDRKFWLYVYICKAIYTIGTNTFSRTRKRERERAREREREREGGRLANTDREMTRQMLAEQRRDGEFELYKYRLWNRYVLSYVSMDNELPLFLSCQLPLMSYRSVFYSYMYKGLAFLPSSLSLSFLFLFTMLLWGFRTISPSYWRWLKGENRLYAHHST